MQIKNFRVGWAIILLNLIVWQAASPVHSQSNTVIQSFILLDHNNIQLVAEIQAYLQTNGGQVLHNFQEQALIVKVPAGVTDSLLNQAGVASIFTEAIPDSALMGYGPEVLGWATVWNSLLAPAETANGLAIDEAHPPDEQIHAFVPPDLPTDKPLELAAQSSVTPGYYQTSEYMAGSVAVGIVLVESDGTGDASTEDWTNEEKQMVFNEVVAGLNWWAELEPRSRLTFVYDDHFSNPPTTSLEPINHPYYDQQYWIAETMTDLGYTSGTYFTQVRDYNNTLRNTYQTDWAFTIFVVDSSADSDNRFTDGLFAYAYLGGPFLVMTSGNNGYGANNMDAVTAHEVGHIFNAYDQYSSANQSCTQRAGYLDVENQNSQHSNCLMNETSIMRGQIYPYQAKAIDQYAAGQIGWRDSDGDDIFDPLDTALPITISTLNQTGNGLTVDGFAEITPYPSPSRTSVTINRLAGVQYRFNGGVWQAAQAGDGLFNETNEAYNFSVTDLPAGIYNLEVAAKDSAGNWSQTYASQTIYVFDEVDGGLNTQFYPVEGVISTSAATTIQGVAYDLGSAPLTKIEYRLQGRPWQAVQSLDGAIDSDYEQFAILIDTPQLEPGVYLLEARATKLDGYVEVNTAHQEITVSDQPLYSIAIPFVIIN